MLLLPSILELAITLSLNQFQKGLHVQTFFMWV